MSCMFVPNFEPIDYVTLVLEPENRPALVTPISGRVDRASATEAVDSGSIPGQDYKNWYSQLSCLTFSIKRDSVKPPPCVVDRWAGGSLTRRPKGPFAVS